MFTCLKCQSRNITPGVRVLEKSDQGFQKDLGLAIDEDPSALMFHGRTETTTYARVCADCGFVELYAEDPQALSNAYKAIIAKGRKS